MGDKVEPQHSQLLLSPSSISTSDAANSDARLAKSPRGAYPLKEESSSSLNQGIGAFTANLFICMLTNAAADLKRDTSLMHLMSTLDLPHPPQSVSEVAVSDKLPLGSAAASNHIQAQVDSVCETSASSAPGIPSSLIVCPASSPSALAITGYCQTWRSNAIWPCCSFVMIASSISVAAIYDSSSTSSLFPVISTTCPQTRSILLQQCVSHLRSCASSILAALPPDALLLLTTGKNGPFLPKKLSGACLHSP